MRTPAEKARKNEAARRARKRSVAVENPAGCPTCGAAWVWDTSGALAVVGGVLIPRHAPGPCVPRPAVPTSDECVADCKRCGEEFSRNANSHAYCSGRCRNEARRAAYRQSKQRHRLPSQRPGVCPYCWGAFWTRRTNQVTCLASECQAAHRRAVSLRWWHEKRRAA